MDDQDHEDREVTSKLAQEKREAVAQQREDKEETERLRKEKEERLETVTPPERRLPA